MLEDEVGSGALPARVVTHHLKKYELLEAAREDGEAFDALFKRARLWVFGYDMDNMKPRGWYSVAMPLVGVPEGQQETLRGWAKRFVDLASDISWTLRNQLKRAWFKRPEDAKGDMSQIDAQFFEATQLAFFTALREMGEVLRGDGLSDDTLELSPETYRQWYVSLKKEAMALFDAQAISGPLEGMKMQQLDRITSARRYLRAYLNGNGKKVQAFANDGGFDLKAPMAERNEESPA